MLIIKFIALLSAGLFSGAAIYINLVEHPARMSCGIDTALKQWRPSYERATIMQASLAVVSLLSALLVWFKEGTILFLIGGLLIGSVIPFTLLVILPTNRKLMDQQTTLNHQELEKLLSRWNKFHMFRSAVSLSSFAVMLRAIVK